MTITATEVINRLVDQPPTFHSSGTRVWNALPATLQLLARHVRKDARTIETGAGASTVVFAAAGTRHTAISPFEEEHSRIREFCETVGVDVASIEFLAQASEMALPGLPDKPGEVDLIFIDGRHSFPAPVLDFYFAWRLLRVGGILVLDDIPIPSVQVVHAFCADSPEWELVTIADDRAGCYRKLADEDWDDNWRRQPFNASYPNFSYARLPSRARLTTIAKASELRRHVAQRYPRLRDSARRLRSGRDGERR
jgi:predicted O-methyltransferase YrrM